MQHARSVRTTDTAGLHARANFSPETPEPQTVTLKASSFKRPVVIGSQDFGFGVRRTKTASTPKGMETIKAWC